MASGWVKVDRNIRESRLWNRKEPYDFRSAYIDLMLEANFKESYIPTNHGCVHVNRGQAFISVINLAKKWQWSRNKVYRFLRTLCDTQLVTLDGTPDGTLVTLLEYDVSEFCDTTDGTQNGTTDGTTNDTTDGTTDGTHHKNIKKNKKERNKEKELTEKEKLTFGETSNVYLTEDEYNKLVAEQGKASTDNAINYLGYYKIEKNYKTRSDYLTIKRWVMDAANKNQKTEPQKIDSAEQRNDEPREEEHEISDEEWLALP
jgi:hypothetical protein